MPERVELVDRRDLKSSEVKYRAGSSPTAPQRVMKKWFVCLYKTNEFKRLERNLLNQNPLTIIYL